MPATNATLYGILGYIHTYVYSNINLQKQAHTALAFPLGKLPMMAFSFHFTHICTSIV